MTTTLDPAQLVGYRPPPFSVAYDERDVALYALGVGVIPFVRRFAPS